MEVKMTTKADEKQDGEMKIPCEVYSRIVGYLRPLQNWHDAKQLEFSERVEYNVDDLVADAAGPDDECPLEAA